MSSDLLDRPCIELKPSFEPPAELTVADYDDRFQDLVASGRDPSRVRGWVVDAPPVESLFPYRQELTRGWVRVFDPEAYDAQMRRLVGLD